MKLMTLRTCVMVIVIAWCPFVVHAEDTLPAYNPGEVPVGAMTIDFTASATHVTHGESTTLTWNVTNAITVTIEPSLGGEVGVSGSRQLYPTSTRTYTLIATNINGRYTSKKVAVLVDEPPSMTLTINPKTASIATGGTVQFHSTVTGTNNTLVRWSTDKGTITSTGLFRAPYYETGSASITAILGADDRKEEKATVSFAPPVAGTTTSATITPVLSLKEGTTTVRASDLATLTWSANSEAKYCVVTGPNGFTASGIVGTQIIGPFSGPGLVTYAMACTGSGDAMGKATLPITITSSSASIQTTTPLNTAAQQTPVKNSILQLPDVVVDQFNYDPKGSFGPMMSIRMRNNGNAPVTQPFVIVMYSDDRRYSMGIVNEHGSFDAGGSIMIHWSAPLGHHVMVVEVDRFDTTTPMASGRKDYASIIRKTIPATKTVIGLTGLIRESNEKNNTATIRF